MPRAKRSIEGTVSIDGFSLIWRLHREQQWFTANGWKGVAIHVSNATGVRRELILEYPSEVTRKMESMKDAPPRQNIRATRVEAHIRQAMVAGWDPESKGHPFVFHVDEPPG